MKLYNYFKLISRLAISFSLLTCSLVFITSCSKELKAGEPMALVYDQIYLIGDATPVGWTIANALPMTVSSDASVFTWTGNLTAGEIKFPTAKNFSSDTFGAAVNGQAITNTKGQISPSGNPDVKWKLTAADAGRYQITLNTKMATVEFKKM
jgi:hypothetical protein